MINRHNVPTRKGKIICNETQLHPPALQSLGEKECWHWMHAYVGWGSGLVFNHKDRPSMALPWTAMYEAFSLRLQEKENDALENISTETIVWRAPWLILRVDIRYVHWIIWLIFLFHAWMATSNRSGVSTSLNLQDCEICQIWIRFWPDTNSISFVHYATWEIWERYAPQITSLQWEAPTDLQDILTGNRTRQNNSVNEHCTGPKSILQLFNMVDYIIHKDAIFYVWFKSVHCMVT